MKVVLRFSIGTIMGFWVAACSPTPVETSLPHSMRVASLPEAKLHRPKTISSDILASIALERVIGQPMVATNIVETLQYNGQR